MSPHPYAFAPFLLLLLSIAVIPHFHKKWWESHYPLLALGFASLTAIYYLVAFHDLTPVYGVGMEYVSFMILIGSLFIVAGGIQIRINRRSTPIANVAFLLLGAVLSNLFGTTGAAMILIRPFLDFNSNRLRAYHVVFFIFIVCNIGGALTPVGDPPLLLGYLHGIPFIWVVQNLWPIWVIATGLMLLTFYVIDSKNVHHNKTDQRASEEILHKPLISVKGLYNLVFLGLILISVFISNPPFVREFLMLLAAAASYFTTSTSVHQENGFEFGPIREVAILFLGIFVTMVPALQWLEPNASVLGLSTPGQYYWGSGVLSSILDSAPTYLNFLTASMGTFVDPKIVHQVMQMVESHGTRLVEGHSEEAGRTFAVLASAHPHLIAQGSASYQEISIAYMLATREVFLRGISAGSVIFGAVTYIGNGPNWIVKTMAERSGVSMPGFFDYIIRYALPILLPLFLLIWLLFFRI